MCMWKIAHKTWEAYFSRVKSLRAEVVLCVSKKNIDGRGFGGI